MRPKRVAPMIAGILIAIAAIWGTLCAAENRRFLALLEEAKREIAGERFGSARVRLSELLARRPGWDEAWYNLGVCEQARQRSQAAWDAFDHVSAGSDWAGWSDVRRSRIAMDRGRFAECEELLIRAAKNPGPHVAEARWGLVLLLRMQGRFDEATRCLQAGFDQMSSPWRPFAGSSSWIRTLSRSKGSSEVWTARADRLPRTIVSGWPAPTWPSGPVIWKRPIVGSRCLGRRPDDPAVWRMKLDWALAADRVDEVRLASSHLPADEESPGRLLALQAWLAAHRQDRDAERRFLRERIEVTRPTVRPVNVSPNWSGKPAILARRRGFGDRSPRSRRPARNTHGCWARRRPSRTPKNWPGSPLASGGLSTRRGGRHSAAPRRQAAARRPSRHRRRRPAIPC